MLLGEIIVITIRWDGILHQCLLYPLAKQDLRVNNRLWITEDLKATFLFVYFHLLGFSF